MEHKTDQLAHSSFSEEIFDLDIAHLHVYSDHSFGIGSSTIYKLVATAKSLGIKHLAITDRGNMFGVIPFYRECIEQEIHPIIGTELSLISDGYRGKAGTGQPQEIFSAILLAANNKGYRNLIKLSSMSFIECFDHEPLIPEKVLSEYCEGLICISPFRKGQLSSLILKNKHREAERCAQRYRDLFGCGSFFIEFQECEQPDRQWLNEGLLKIAQKLDIPVIAANEVHYARKEDYCTHQVFRSLNLEQNHGSIENDKYSTNQYFMWTSEEMTSSVSTMQEALKNTVRIAKRCNLEMLFPGPILPNISVPHPFLTPSEYLRDQVYAGLQNRFEKITEEYERRADYELNAIDRKNATNYFLIVADYVRWARLHRIPIGPGHCFITGSLVAYALGITDIDPIQYRLYFERFMNPGSNSLPLICIDLCAQRRHEVIDYLKEKYGEDCVATLVTAVYPKKNTIFKTIACRLAIPDEEIERMANLIPDDPRISFCMALYQDRQLHILSEDPKYSELFDLIKKSDEWAQCVLPHEGGIVIGARELSDFVPVCRELATGERAIHDANRYLEECGLAEFYIFGNEALTILQNAENLIRQRGIDYAAFCIRKIVLTDAPTFGLLREGRTIGVTFFDSPDIQEYLLRTGPEKLSDLFPFCAYARSPSSHFIEQFIEAKQKDLRCCHPLLCLIPTLEESYGIIIYQEQIIEIAHRIGGYDLGEAEIFRRTLMKNKEPNITNEKRRFVTKAGTLGYPEEETNMILLEIEKANRIGLYAKCILIPLALTAYRSAYIKTHFPAEFITANLNHDLMDTMKIAVYIEEAMNFGLSVELPYPERDPTGFEIEAGRIVAKYA